MFPTCVCLRSFPNGEPCGSICIIPTMVLPLELGGKKKPPRHSRAGAVPMEHSPATPSQFLISCLPRRASELLNEADKEEKTYEELKQHGDKLIKKGRCGHLRFAAGGRVRGQQA